MEEGRVRDECGRLPTRSHVRWAVTPALRGRQAAGAGPRSGSSGRARTRSEVEPSRVAARARGGCERRREDVRRRRSPLDRDSKCPGESSRAAGRRRAPAGLVRVLRLPSLHPVTAAASIARVRAWSSRNGRYSVYSRNGDSFHPRSPPGSQRGHRRYCRYSGARSAEAFRWTTFGLGLRRPQYQAPFSPKPCRHFTSPIASAALDEIRGSMP